MRLRTSIALVTVASLLALPATAVVASAGPPTSTDLVGAEEVPGPGDADATGFADITLKKSKGTVCFDVSWANVDGTVVAGHIHVGDAGVAGPVVVPLVGVAGEGTGSASSCQTGVSPELIKAIRQNPSGYYVNVHSTAFPAGAIRGQLG